MRNALLLACVAIASSSGAMTLPKVVPVPIYFVKTGWFLCGDATQKTLFRRSWFDIQSCFWFVSVKDAGHVVLSLKKNDLYVAVDHGKLILSQLPYAWALGYQSVSQDAFAVPFHLSSAAGYVSAGAMPPSFSYAPTPSVQMTPLELAKQPSDDADEWLHFGTPPVR